MRQAIVCALVALSCGKVEDLNHDGVADGIRSPDNVSAVAPGTPIGTLSGQVLTTDFAPLDGVVIDVLIGGVEGPMGKYTAQSNAEGNYFVTGLPAGGFAQLTLSKADYATARATAFVPGSAGNFQVNNGNGAVGAIMLAALTDSFHLQIVTAGGQPAKNLKPVLEVSPAALRYSDTTGGYGTPVGVFVADDTATNDDGVITWTKIPGLAEESRLDGVITITVPAYDENNDMLPDYLGTRVQFSARAAFQGTAPKVLTLAHAHVATPANIVASNVDSMVNGVGDPLKSMIRGGEPLYFVFDQAMIDASITVRLTDESGVPGPSPIAFTKLLRGTNILVVTPMNPLEQGKEYNIAIRATSLENGSTFQKAAYLFGGDPTQPKGFAIEKVTFKKAMGNMANNIQPGDRVLVIFNQPIRNTGATPVELFFDADLNNDGTRTLQGELSLMGATNPNTVGFPVFPNEPIAEVGSTFANLPSGYTTRYEFVYPAAMPYMGVANTPRVLLFFSEIPSSLFGYRTIWGTGIESDQTVPSITP